MNRILISFLCASMALTLTCQPSYCQDDKNKDSLLLKAAREIIADAGICALITLDEKGSPRVRAMDPFPPEDDFTIWFGTNKESRKVEQIKKDPRVVLYYLDDDQSGYVTISGTAELVDDPAEKEKYWKPLWEAFYKDDRENYLLIKVSPEWLEISSNGRGILSDPVTWQTPRLVFRKNQNKK